MAGVGIAGCLCECWEVCTCSIALYDSYNIHVVPVGALLPQYPTVQARRGYLGLMMAITDRLMSGRVWLTGCTRPDEGSSSRGGRLTLVSSDTLILDTYPYAKPGQRREPENLWTLRLGFKLLRMADIRCKLELKIDDASIRTQSSP